ncbi:hypothetical protein, partial [Flavobacterium aestuarii]|uniref:hypothetical protein n=1 Tax=Flavobacterium aestuarii TaxID=3149227 RepID=UPI0032B4872D
GLYCGLRTGFLPCNYRKKRFFHSLTCCYYSGFGTKLSPFFGFAKSFKYKTIFPLNQLPKSVVVAVSGSRFGF